MTVGMVGRTVDPIRRERRLVRTAWLLAGGVALPLLGWWLTTWEGNYHSGSVWTYINQAESRAEPWSAAAIESNREHLVVAALLALAGLACLVVGLVVVVRTLRRTRRGPLGERHEQRLLRSRQQ